MKSQFPLASHPSARIGHTASISRNENTVYIVAGEDSKNNILNDIWSFDIESGISILLLLLIIFSHSTIKRILEAVKL